MTQTIEFNYKEPRRITDNLWVIDGDFSHGMGRRMTVIKMANENLLVHNAIKLRPDSLTWLNTLGQVATIMIPNAFHAVDALWFSEQYPEATIYAPKKKQQMLSDAERTHKPLEEFPQSADFESIYIEGTVAQEIALLHKPSRSLILTDMAFNLMHIDGFMTKLFASLFNINGRFGPSRLMKWAFVKDKQRFYHSIRAVFDLDFDRVIVNHGDIFENDAKAAYLKGFKEIFKDFDV